MNKLLKKKYNLFFFTLILMGILSVVLLSLATLIATIKIPDVEEKIQEQTRIIDELRYKIETDLIQGLYGIAPETQQGIDVLNIQLEQIKSGSESKLKDLLIKRAIRSFMDEIKRWNKLFMCEEVTKNQVEKPSLESNVSPDKIKELEQTLAKSKENAFSRLKQMVEEIHRHNNLKAEYEKEQDIKQWWFALFQIMGLITLVATTICEGIEKLSLKQKDKQVS